MKNKFKRAVKLSVGAPCLYIGGTILKLAYDTGNNPPGVQTILGVTGGMVALAGLMLTKQAVAGNKEKVED